MLLTNYHTHTNYCDGKELPVLYAEAALKQNIKVLGYSAHAPVPFPCIWTIPIDNYPEYTDSIHSLKTLYSGRLEILHGLEIDFIPDLWPQMRETLKPDKLDYFIGSIHFVDCFPDGTRWSIDGSNTEFREGWESIFHKDSHKLVQKYFEYTRQMIREMKPTIVGHLDKIKMQYSEGCFIPETDSIYRKELMQTLEEIAYHGSVVELNTRGAYRRNEKELYPSFWVLTEMAKMKIPVVINSDAHHPYELTLLFEMAVENLKKAGYESISYFSGGKWFDSKVK